MREPESSPIPIRLPNTKKRWRRQRASSPRCATTPASLLQLPERFLDRVKVRQFLRRWRLFAILHDAVLIDHKSRARAHRAQAKQVRQQRAVGLRGLFIQVARERDADFFLLRPRLLRE